MKSVNSLRLAPWVLGALALTIAWDLSGFDLILAHVFGNDHGFAWREHWLQTAVFHNGAKVVAWLLALTLVLAVWWPVGSLRRIPKTRRVQLAATTVIATVLVSVIKMGSHTSCPWDLQEFGGMAHYVSHWSWGSLDGGHGRCFPAGHASAGFAFVGGYFAFRTTDRKVALRWLFGALAAGLVLGLAQQVRGAHFMSHTLWTAWVCWAAAWAGDAATQWWLNHHEQRPVFEPAAFQGTR